MDAGSTREACIFNQTQANCCAALKLKQAQLSNLLTGFGKRRLNPSAPKPATTIPSLCSHWCAWVLADQASNLCLLLTSFLPLKEGPYPCNCGLVISLLPADSQHQTPCLHGPCTCILAIFIQVSHSACSATYTL